MAKKYEIPESEPMIVNEPSVGYGTDISRNQAEIEEDADFDLARAISGEEMLERVIADIREMYRKKS